MMSEPETDTNKALCVQFYKILDSNDDKFGFSVTTRLAGCTQMVDIDQDHRSIPCGPHIYSLCTTDHISIPCAPQISILWGSEIYSLWITDLFLAH